MILVVAAMRSEVDMILNRYAFKPVKNETDLYLLNHKSKQILLKITGVGKVNAAHGLTSVISKYSIDKIYNMGFAGASAMYHQSEIVFIKEARYHDFDLTIFGYEKGQVPNFPAFFTSDQKLIKHANHISANRQSTLYTGDIFMTENASRDFLVDMEGAALYQIAHILSIPILSVKVVSDIIGMNNHIASYQAFEANKGAIILNDLFEKIILEV